MNYWQGKNIRLRAIEPSDAESFYAWDLDSDMGRYLDRVWPPVSLESQKRWTERDSAKDPEKETRDEIFFVIENLAGEMVGMLNTHHCEPRSGVFSYGVAVQADFKRRGYASEAIRMVLRYFFEELRYQKVNVEIHSDNNASAKLHEALGFQLEGRMRRTIYSGGQFLDNLLYGMTAEEFHIFG
jgi:RimJ/RimL family protein N-acetyltransferase